MTEQIKLVQENVPLASLTSWRVGGAAQYFCSPRNIDEVSKALAWVAENKNPMPITVLGGGSNSLISDKGIPGLVMSMRKLVGVDVKEVDGNLKVTAMAGTHKSQILRVFIKECLAPALFISGLPGDVGGGVVMNAGVSEDYTPREFCEIVEWVEVFRLEKGKPIRVVIPSDEIIWKYRHSEGWQPGILVQVGLSWPIQRDEEIPSKVKKSNFLRLSKQPLDQPSCGSVFMNTPNYRAGAMIDKCGLRGYCIGGAQVSKKHANFIVNTGAATASDIDELIKYIQKIVEQETGISLQKEVVYLGDWSKS